MRPDAAPKAAPEAAPEVAPEVAPHAPAADWIASVLRGNTAFVVLAAEPDTASLEAAIAGLDPDQVATIRIRNPLTAPLSLERVMLQLAPEDDDEDGPALDEARRLLRAVTVCAAGRPCLLVVVEQAETLTASALALLELLPGLQAPGVARVRVAFVGTPAFQAMLADPRFQVIRGHGAEPQAPDAAEPPVPEGAVAPAATLSLPPAYRPPGKGRLVAVLVAASVAVAVLLVATLRPSETPPIATPPAIPPPVVTAPVATAPVATAPVATAPVATALVEAAVPPAPTAAPPAQSTASSPIEAVPGAGPEAAPPPLAQPAIAAGPAAARARVFREFNAFVEGRGLAGRLSRSDREALFQEYLVRRQTATVPAAAPPDATAASELPEVLLFFQAGAPGAEAVADQNATILRHQMPDVTLRPVPDSLPDPIVKFFRSEDRALALAVALALAPAATDWQVVDMSSAAKRPARATIEVWLPRPPAAP